VFTKAILFLNTLKYLKFQQLFKRLTRIFISIKPDLSPAPAIAIPVQSLKMPIKKQVSMLSEFSFNFLNLESEVKNKIDWNSPNHDKLWLYNLHYFDDLNSLDSEKRRDWHYNLIYKWIVENPPGDGIGWDAYPSSLRITNWIKWSICGNGFDQNILNSLAIQLRYLSKNLETHLLGNHYFANAKALYFGGLFFTGPEADNWYKVGSSILISEIEEQVLNDGGHFELSPMYHSIFCEDLLDLFNIDLVYNKKSLPILKTKIIDMLSWIKVMSHPDKKLSFFNDATFGVAPRFDDLNSYAKRLNIEFNLNLNNTLSNLKDSGYIRVNGTNIVAILDVAKIGPNYLPGHGHADALSFEISLFGSRFIVNSGISTYNVSNERQMQRGTSMHSTINIDNKDSSELWSAFRVGRRANIKEIKINQKDSLNISASHDGYYRLFGKPCHCREWIFSDNQLKLLDTVLGHGFHKIESVLPLGPEVEIIKIQNNKVELCIQNQTIIILFNSNGHLELINSKYFIGFGQSLNNQHLVLNYEGNLPFTSSIEFQW
jgi:uncharacterized heparinase superfamily protein